MITNDNRRVQKPRTERRGQNAELYTLNGGRRIYTPAAFKRNPKVISPVSIDWSDPVSAAFETVADWQKKMSRPQQVQYRVFTSVPRLVLARPGH